MKLLQLNRLFVLLAFGFVFLITTPMLSAKRPPKHRSPDSKIENLHKKTIGCGLEFNEEQLDEVHTIKEEIRETVKSLQKQKRVVSKNLRNEMKLEEPSDVAVGKLVISKNNFSEEIREARDSFKESFMTILTPEQLDRMWKLCSGLEPDQSESDTSEKKKHKGKLK